MPDKASGPLLAQLSATLEKDEAQRRALVQKIKVRGATRAGPAALRCLQGPQSARSPHHPSGCALPPARQLPLHCTSRIAAVRAQGALHACLAHLPALAPPAPGPRALWCL